MAWPESSPNLSLLWCECCQRRHVAIMPELADTWQIVVGLVVDDGIFQHEDVTTFQGNACRRPRSLGLYDRLDVTVGHNFDDTSAASGRDINHPVCIHS